MNLQEAIQKREELLARQRKLNHAIKILQSETFEKCSAIDFAIYDYQQKVEAIDVQIADLARQVEVQSQVQPQPQVAINPDVLQGIKSIVDILARFQNFAKTHPNASDAEIQLRLKTGQF